MARGVPDERPARERGKLYVSVVQEIEANILSGALKVGDRLPSEADIARTHAVSTRSVREALQILETRGLVRRRHGERAMVVRDDIGEFLGSLAQTVRNLFSDRSEYLVQLMDVRRLIECDVVRRLAHDKPAMPDVEAALERMTAAVVANDPARFTDADAAFHLALVRSVGNEILNVLYDNLFSIIVDVIRVSSKVPDKPLPDAWAEHDRIYRLIRDGDEAAAVEAIRRQIDDSSDYLRVAMASAASRRPRRT